MGFLLGGLLSGAGAGFSEIARQRREDALIATRRQFQQEDQAAEDTREIEKEKRDATLKVGLLTLAQQYKKEDRETEAEYAERLERIKSGLRVSETASKAKIDVAMEVLKSKLNRLESAEAARLEAQLRSGEVSDIRAADDGSMIVTYKGGREEIKGIKLRDTRADSAEEPAGGAIGAARARRDGTLTPKPKGVASAAPAKAADPASDLWAALATIPAPAKGQPTTRTMSGPTGRVAIQWTGTRWQPTGKVQ